MEIINAIQILQILETNSFPIKIFGNDFNIYYAKTIFNYQPPFVDVINEMIGNKIYQSWGINVPKMCVLTIDNDLLQNFIKTSGMKTLYSKYNSNKLFFVGFQEIEDQTELDCHSLSMNNKNDYNKFNNPIDFLNIAFCDIWLGNRDRRISNPNILIAQEGKKLSFFAIDHTQLFAHQQTYKSLNLSQMDFDRNNMLITSDLFKKICTFADQVVISKYSSTIIDCINNTNDNIANFFSDIPSDIGFSLKGRKKVISILADEDRNKRIAESFKSFIK